MTHAELENILQEVFPIVEEVSHFIKHEQQKVTQSDIITKASNSLVTYVDQTAEDMLVKGLKEILPAASFLTEEGRVENAESNLVWIIDPLDGTTNFLYNIPFFSVSVALKHNNQMVLGVVRAVMQGENFYAIAGGGAFRDGIPLTLDRPRPVKESILATGNPNDDASRTDH